MILEKQIEKFNHICQLYDDSLEAYLAYIGLMNIGTGELVDERKINISNINMREAVSKMLEAYKYAIELKTIAEYLTEELAEEGINFPLLRIELAEKTIREGEIYLDHMIKKLPNHFNLFQEEKKT